MKKIIVIGSIIGLLISLLMVGIKNSSLKMVYFPEGIVIEKEGSQWGRTTWVMTTYRITSEIIPLTLHDYPLYENGLKDKKIIKWSSFQNLRPIEQKEIIDFLEYEKFEINTPHLITAVYEERNSQGRIYFDFWQIGMIDTLENKFYLMEWIR